jgi:hypothetical protein
MGTVSNAGVSTSNNADGTISAVVTWTTDIPADSSVSYGPGAGPGGAVGKQTDSNFVTAHSITLPGLSASTGYFALIVSSDPDGDVLGYDPSNPGPSGIVTFTTPAPPPPPPPPPVVQPPTSNSVVINWTSSSAGLGTAFYTPAGGVQMSQPEDSEVPSTSHQATLTDLLGSTNYSGYCETDLESTNVDEVTAPFSFTTQQSVSTDPPGHVAMTAVPSRVKVGGVSSVCVQVLQRDGSPQVGIPVAFSLGAGRAGVTPATATGLTGADGQCHVQFTVTDIPPKQIKGRRFVVAMVGAAGGPQKRRRTLLVGLQ